MSSQPKQPTEPKEDPSNKISGAFEIQPIRPVRPSQPNPTNQAVVVNDVDNDPGEFSREEHFKGIYSTRDGVRFRDKDVLHSKSSRWLVALALSLVTFLALSVAAYLTLRFSEKANRWVQSKMVLLKTLKMPEAIAPYVYRPLELWEKSLAGFNGPGSKGAAEKKWSSMSCHFLIQEAMTRKLKGPLDPEGSYLLASCQLFKDMPQIAIRSINEEDALHSNQSSVAMQWEDLPGKLLASEVKFRLHALEVQAPIRFPFCIQWQASADCFFRFVVQSRQPLRVKLDGAYKILESGIRNRNVRFAAWLNWAAGLNAIKVGQYEQGELYLKKASEKLRLMKDPFLEREVFRVRVQNAWLQSSRDLMQKVWKGRPSKLMKEDSLAFLDVDLMHKAMIKSPGSYEPFQAFLDSPESFQRYRFDPYLIQMIVEQAINFQKLPEASRYLDHIIESQEDPLATQGVEWLDILRLRLLVAQSKGLEALQLIQSMEKRMQKSPLLTHMKGLALLHAFTSKPYRLKAAQEFQKSINAGSRGPSYFALVVSFLEANELVKAEATLSFWQRDGLSSADGPWVALARSLIRYREGDLDAAQRAWQDIANAHPDFTVVRKLEHNVKEDPKYLEEQLFTRLSQMLPMQSPLGPLVEVSQKP